MLSAKYEYMLNQLVANKDAALLHDRSKNYNYQIHKIYGKIVSLLRLGDALTNTQDKYTYNNFYNNVGIVCSGTLWGTKKGMDLLDTNEILNLNYMDDESKQFISECIDYITNINKKLDKTIYKKLANTDKITSNNKDYIILQIHYLIMMMKIYFIWKNDFINYMADMMPYNNIMEKYNIKFIPHDINNRQMDFITTALLPNTFKDNIKDLESVIDILEDLVVKYKNIPNVIDEFKVSTFISAKETNANKLNKPKLCRPVTRQVIRAKLTKDDLKKYKVTGLRDLCKERNIRGTSKLNRAGLEKKLLES